MAQHNIIASFDSRDDANWAVEELMHANLRTSSVRVLPPPSARPDTFRDAVIVSCVLDDTQRHRAEDILGRRGALDLKEDMFFPRGSYRRMQMPWGTIIGAGLAVMAGATMMLRNNNRRDEDEDDDDMRYLPSPTQARRTAQNYRPSQSTASAADIADAADLGFGDHSDVYDETPVSTSREPMTHPGALSSTRSVGASQSDRFGSAAAAIGASSGLASPASTGRATPASPGEYRRDTFKTGA